MNTLTPHTEPRSFAGALADIRSLQQRVATATRVLLRQHGWRHSCLNPPHLWLWSKQLPDGRILLTDLDTALAIQSALAGQPPLAPHALAAPSRATSTKPLPPRLPRHPAHTPAR